MEYFITEIDIKKVRHLENLPIKLSDTERKHLILTGKNGSGKTSVLECMRDYLKSIENNFLHNIKNFEKIIEDMNKAITLFPQENSNNVTSYKTGINNYKQQLNNYKYNEIGLQINGDYGISGEYQNSNFILVYFPSKRINTPNLPNGINKLEFPTISKFENNLNKDLIQYLVNLQTRSLYAEKKKDTETVNQIDTWFANFTKILQTVLRDDTLELDFDIDNMNFNILTKGREKFDFTTLSDGYSAFLNIVVELMLRMESKAPKVYDIQGIVLIDEIETHLHIDLQKKIMPLLTTFFPKIQFIVTTHSPFVLSSISNAVIYDLENHSYLTDVSDLSYSALIKYHFRITDEYSILIKHKIADYQGLIEKKERTETENKQLFDLDTELSNLSPVLSPELYLQFTQLQEQLA